MEMKDSQDELPVTWLAQPAQRLASASAGHPQAIDLLICLTVAVASIGGLSTQQRLNRMAA
jgi:hypothetical protein